MLVDSLFYKDNYLNKFDTIVKELEKIDEDKYRVVLEETAFYPEGGGQPSDVGTMNGYYVYKVEEKNGKIYHYIDDNKEENIAIGMKVKCNIDFDKRFSNMQLHTGEHILSGIICKKYNATNVGFHIGTDFTTMDFDVSIPQKDLALIEKEANEAIYKAIKVESKFYKEDEVKNIEYRSKKELKGIVRLVKIEGYDICACCGVHVSNTSEIGIIKIVKAEKYKKGVRIYMLAGDKAIEDYTNKYMMLKDLSNLLSLKMSDVYSGVNNLLVEIDKLKKENNEIKFKNIKEKINNLKDDSIIIFDEDKLDDANLKRSAEFIIKSKDCKVALVISNNKFILISKEIDLKEITNSLRNKGIIRGGGNLNLVQGQILLSKEELINEIKM